MAYWMGLQPRACPRWSKPERQMEMHHARQPAFQQYEMPGRCAISTLRLLIPDCYTEGAGSNHQISLIIGVAQKHHLDAPIEASGVKWQARGLRQRPNNHPRSSFAVVAARRVELSILTHKLHHVCPEEFRLFFLCFLLGTSSLATLTFFSVQYTPLLCVRCRDASAAQA